MESFIYALDFNDCGNVPYTIAMFVAKRSVVKTGRPLKMAAELHPRSGKLIGLSNSNRTARRNQPVQEFNHGLVLSKEPLRDRDVFTVRIDKKVNKSRPLAMLLLSGALAGRLREERSLNGPAVCRCPQWSAAVITHGVLTAWHLTVYDAGIQGSHRLECQKRMSRWAPLQALSIFKKANENPLGSLVPYVSHANLA